MSVVVAGSQIPAHADRVDVKDPRESMRVLPGFLQLPLTFLTGKPFAGQRAAHLSPTFHLVAASSSLLGGVAISAVALRAQGLWTLLLIVGWAMTLHGMRNLRMMIFHQCSHRNMYGRPRPDSLIGQAVSSVLIVQNFADYSREHVGDHHSVHHMTLRDPTVQAFLRTLRFQPGMSRAQLWRLLIARLLSPKFHALFAISRVRSFLHGATTAEKIAAATFYGGLLVVAAITGAWITILLAWFVPLVPLFQVSNTLRLCVKHTFPDRSLTERRGKAYYAALTNAIFIGEATPSATGDAVRTTLAWVRWFARIAFVHFPSRYLVLTGDTVVHDYHHRHPASKQWHDYIFARQADVDAGHRGWPPYHEAWGLIPAINLVLDSISAADPVEFDPSRIGAVSERELFNAFDD